ncbi:hypothetical protein FLA_2605 [Filimonas lacunae]|nr:hypothetical protein FLA_2605 [Filimonas lacunae]
MVVGNKGYALKLKGTYKPRNHAVLLHFPCFPVGKRRFFIKKSLV